MKSLRIVSVLGARPQFIKAAPVTFALRMAGHDEFILHTGQHYDYGMSKVFFDEMELPEPDINLGVGSGSHAEQTGAMLIGIEKVLVAEKPDWVVVYGDTNSTLAGALAAVKLRLPLAHVEAGLRSFNPEMPEEHNRVLTDHCAELLFTPTEEAVKNLAEEGLTTGVHQVGDTMYDAVLRFLGIAHQHSNILKDLDLEPKGYYLATVHRPSNTDRHENLSQILSAFRELDKPVVFPVHPRTRERIDVAMPDIGPADLEGRLLLLDPVGYLDMLILEEQARAILTDSGGMQKEAYLLRVPCITLRSETEWVETVEAGWNVLTGPDTDKILRAVESSIDRKEDPAAVFGDGHAAERIVTILIGIT